MKEHIIILTIRMMPANIADCVFIPDASKLRIARQPCLKPTSPLATHTQYILHPRVLEGLNGCSVMGNSYSHRARSYSGGWYTKDYV